jgi:hypothetical protein
MNKRGRKDRDMIRVDPSFIADSLIGMAYSFPNPDVLRYKFADLLQLYARTPSCVSIWHGEDRILCSHPDQDLRAYEQTNPDLGNVFRRPVECVEIAPGLRIGFRELPSGTRLDGLLEAILAPLREDAAGWRILIDNIARPLARVNEATGASLPYAALSPGEIDSFLERFRRRIDAALESSFILDSPLLRWTDLNKGSWLSNLFAVVRYVPYQGYLRVVKGSVDYKYDYTARVLLFDRSIETIREVQASDWPESDRRIAVLERPLDEHSRFISDTCLESGCVHLAHTRKSREDTLGFPKHDYAASGPQKQRHDFEGALYERFFPGFEQTVFFPVHVGGAPWISLYSFVDPNQPLQLYRLYREIIPKVADRIREAAAEAFLDSIAAEFNKNAVLGLSSRLDLLHSSWLKLSMLCPFPVVELSPDVATPDGSDDKSVTVGTQSFTVRFRRDLQPMKAKADYGAILEGDVANRLRQECYKLRSGRESAFNDVFHGSGTALQYADPKPLIRYLSRYGRVPLASPNDFRFKITDRAGNPESREAIRCGELIVAELNRLEVAYESSIALIRFGEIATTRTGKFRRKFQESFTRPLELEIRDQMQLVLQMKRAGGPLRSRSRKYRLTDLLVIGGFLRDIFSPQSCEAFS